MPALNAVFQGQGDSGACRQHAVFWRATHRGGPREVHRPFRHSVAGATLTPRAVVGFGPRLRQVGGRIGRLDARINRLISLVDEIVAQGGTLLTDVFGGGGAGGFGGAGGPARARTPRKAAGRTHRKAAARRPTARKTTPHKPVAARKPTSRKTTSRKTTARKPVKMASRPAVATAVSAPAAAH
jgi:hypothetical protein